jgi:hypothetical protein
VTRRTVLISGVSLALLACVAALAILKWNNGGSKVTVSFLKSEPSHGQFPLYAESERLDFAARNAGSKPASVYLLALQDQQGQWVSSLPPQKLGDLGAAESAQLYLYLPRGSHPRSLRMRVNVKASALQKVQFALNSLISNSRPPGNQLWFDQLRVPANEFVVSLGNETDPKGPTNRTQSVCAETNLTAAEPASRR